MAKVPHRKVPTDYGWDYKPVELTGKCKRIRYPSGSVYEYIQCQRRIFGIKAGTYWWLKEDIKLMDTIEVEYYDCNCSR